ncbi:hypothetical protein Tco_0544964 [Tanacetum coccineum]
MWCLKKSNTVAFGTVYKADGKQMLHNQELPNDCYKVSIDESVVDAACVPDVGNNGLKTVKDGVGGFFAWPKNQVVIEEDKVTPPTTIQKISDDNSAPKLQHLKRKSYVSRETMQRQARTAKSQKSKDEAPEEIKIFLKKITVLLQASVIINDHEDIGKLGAKGDIGFFIGYSANSRAYRVYNRRTKKIMETMNVTFDVLAMAFEQSNQNSKL